MGAIDQLPWRGPGGDRPDLPLPPDRMPLLGHGALRKRWRYVGVYGEQAMLCAAQVEVGPLGQCFWALWDREGRTAAAHTRLRPGGREVVMRGPELEIDGAGVRARLRLGECAAVESICPSGGGWGWTRKRAGVPVRGTIETARGSWQVDGHGVDDESAGYHARRTSWSWSAGVGRRRDGRPVAWNLVAGINDPPERSERGIWLDGTPSEPAPVAFRGLDAVEFDDGSLLAFAAESERARRDNFLLVRSRYRHLFGTFSGSLQGAELAEGFGVMEAHEAVW